MDDVLDGQRHDSGGADLRKRGRFHGGMRQQQLHRRFFVEGQPARQHFVEDDADTVQIAAAVHRLAAGLFGAHVARRADGELGVADLTHAVGRIRGAQLGQAEVHHLEHLVIRVRIDDHQVGRLQIAVDDAFGVGGLQDLAEHAQQPADAGRLHPLPAAQ